MNHPIGTLAWARETGGQLSRRESLQLFRELLGAQLRLIPDDWLHTFGVRQPRSSGISLDDLAPPDSATATSAANRVQRDITGVSLQSL